MKIMLMLSIVATPQGKSFCACQLATYYNMQLGGGYSLLWQTLVLMYEYSLLLAFILVFSDLYSNLIYFEIRSIIVVVFCFHFKFCSFFPADIIMDLSILLETLEKNWYWICIIKCRNKTYLLSKVLFLWTTSFN